MNDTTKSPTFSTSSQDAKICHAEAAHQEKGVRQPLPQMQQFGLFSNFDGIGFVSYDGNPIANDCRSQHGQRMVLQEMKSNFEHRLPLFNEEMCR